MAFRPLAGAAALAALACISGCASHRHSSRPTPPPVVVPLPATVELSKEAPFVIAGKTVIVALSGDEAERAAAASFNEGIAHGNAWAKTGLALPILDEPQGRRQAIEFELDESADLGDEGYTLDSSSKGVLVRASSAAGLLYGAHSLRQLVTPRCDPPNGSFCDLTVPAIRIVDAPRFAWRGLMLDCSRHFIDVASIKRVLDQMAQLKLNVFHWHLIDNNGWRMPSDRYPKLNTVGAFPGTAGDGFSGYYTKDDVREIVAYAKARHIAVVPELEMPAHCNAGLAAYPELTCTGQPLAPGNGGAKHFTEKAGVLAMCAGKETTFEFIEGIIDETVAMFDSPVIHIGGDERPKGVWEKCPHCQARIQQLGLVDEHALQEWFMRRVSDMLAARGRRPMSWAVTRTDPYNPADMDDLGNDAIVHNWHDGAAFAARRGSQVVNSNNPFLYLDYPEVPGLGKPEWMPILDVAKIYSFDPVPAGLTPEEQSRIIGAEACLWTELVPQEELDVNLFPRLLAVSEVFWTPQENRDLADFERRSRSTKLSMQRQGVQFREAAAAE